MKTTLQTYDMGRPRYEPITALRFTTTSVTNCAYVFDRVAGKHILGCPHLHRNHRTAMRCACRMLRRFLTGELQL